MFVSLRVLYQGLSDWERCVCLQLGTWVDELRQELQAEESRADSLEATERLLEQTAQQRDSSLDACASTIAQGEALLQELRLVTNCEFYIVSNTVDKQQKGTCIIITYYFS